MATKQPDMSNMENEQNNSNTSNSTNNEASTTATNTGEQTENTTSKGRKGGNMNPAFNKSKAAMTAKKASQEFYKQVNDLAQSKDSVPSAELMAVLEKFKRLSIDRAPRSITGTKSFDPNKKDTTRPPRTKRPPRNTTQTPSYTPPQADEENTSPAPKQKFRPYPRRTRKSMTNANTSKPNSEQPQATEASNN